MTKSVLSAFVNGTRALLSAQLIACVAAVALAGWTLGVTSQVLRERNRLQERVIQLEEAMASSGVIPPPPAAVVATQGDAAYPGSIVNALAPGAGTESSDVVATARGRQNIITTLFGPAPPLRTVVLHVRAESDFATAEKIARNLQGNGLHALINIMTASDQRPAGYAYFDGRQSRAAADIVARFHDLAREQQVAQWSAQLRGTALPARGEYAADRLDIVLPPLPVVAPPTEAAAAPSRP